MKSVSLNTLWSYLLMSLFAFHARGANIEVLGGQVILSGRIIENDAAKFALVTKGLPEETIVRLQSPGGRTIEGIDIGKLIQKRRFVTYASGGDCASACGLIWLSGIKRWIHASARIGFHQSYDSRTLKASVVGNAAVGHYLSEIGMPIAVVGLATKSKPNEMNWLTKQKANVAGIAYRVGRPSSKNYRLTYPNRKFGEIGSDKETAPHVPFIRTKQGASILSNPCDYSGDEAQALCITFRLFSKDQKLESAHFNLDELPFSETVLYYGKSTSRDKILEDKRKQFLRWPNRAYQIFKESVYLNCNQYQCTVKGRFKYDFEKYDLQKASGWSTFLIRIQNSEQKIIAEDGQVF